MYLHTVIECPHCRVRIVRDSKLLRFGTEMSCPICGLNFSCWSREISQALKSLTR